MEIGQGGEGEKEEGVPEGQGEKGRTVREKGGRRLEVNKAELKRGLVCRAPAQQTWGQTRAILLQFHQVLFYPSLLDRRRGEDEHGPHMESAGWEGGRGVSCGRAGDHGDLRPSGQR